MEIITIERHILEQQRNFPEATGEFTYLLYDIALAAKIISREVSKAGLAEIMGFAGEVTDPNGAAITTVQIKLWDGEGWESFQVPGARTDVVSNYRVNFGGSTAWWEQHVPFSCHASKTFYLQVIANGRGVSPVVKVAHSEDCEHNLIMTNFKRRY